MQHRVALIFLEPLLLGDGRVAEADVEPARWHHEVVGMDDGDPVEPAIHDAGGFDGVLDRLQPNPGAGKARQRPGIKAVIDDLLHAGRVQHRDHHVDEMKFALMGGGGALAGVIVTHERDHAAMLGGARIVGVAEHVAGAVHPRSLAVPEAEHAIEFAFAPKLRLLGAPERGGGQILVEAGLELDVVGLEQLVGAAELLVEPAQRRAAIAGDIAGRVEASAPVPRLLHQGKAHQRLGAGNEDPVLSEIVFVVEGNGLQCHLRLQGGPAHVPVGSRRRRASFPARLARSVAPGNFVVLSRSARKLHKSWARRILAQRKKVRGTAASCAIRWGRPQAGAGGITPPAGAARFPDSR